MADLEPCVLIVDDEKRDIELVEEALSPIRLRILKLAEPGEVLRKVESERPDVVILDALLPGMSGFDLCKEIKSSPDSKNTAILILTGVYLRDHYRREAIHQFKADGFLIKPFRVRELQRTFLKILARKLRTSPRKVQEELVANQDILLPSELEEKTGWFGRIFGKRRSSPAPSVEPGFLRAARTSVRASAEPVKTGEPPVVPAEEKPTAKPETRESRESEREPESVESGSPKLGAATEEKPEEPERLEEPEKHEKDVEAEEEKEIVAGETPVLAETSAPTDEKAEDGEPHDTLGDGERAPVVKPAQVEGVTEPPGAEQVEPLKGEPLETSHEKDAQRGEAAEKTPDGAVQGHLSSVWDDLPAGVPVEAPSKKIVAGVQEVIESAESVDSEPDAFIEAEASPPEPENVKETESAEAEPEPVIEAEASSRGPVEAELVVPESESEPTSETEPAPAPVPTLEGEAVAEAKAPPEPEPAAEPSEEPPETESSPAPKDVDLDSAKALFEALEVEGIDDEEAEMLVNADPSATMPAIDPVIIRKIIRAKAAATSRAAPSEAAPETPVEEDGTTGEVPPTAEPAEKPVKESVAEIVDASKAEPSEAPPVEVEAGEVGETTEEPEAEVAAQPQPEVEASREVSDTEAAPGPVPEAVLEAAAPGPEPTPETEARPEPELITKPMARPVSESAAETEPAAETDEAPTPELRRDLAIYREPDFMRELKRELSKCRRVERPMTLILVRITDLGQIVEIFGKDYRPKVLMHVAEQLLDALRDVDSVGLMESRELLALTAFASDRYGGERIVARLRKALRNHPFDVGLGIAGFVPKLFFGMASFPNDADTVEELLDHAEKEISAG